ncbi:PREDICTED: uncharacterized protein LOC109476834 [Branchiostoma belcheri]|uniref:Uncharacterized protein LOC109476834 n=1 Tax=Branchiostoma belcheri TaxID=7741 RepID=A0A6P4ZUY4_BRABE|nr:PREDICTED: uncharacterized protein LOC109476834 [Branchiostoma belcheri]
MNGDSVLTFTCNTGYNLVGPSTLTSAQMQQCPILTEPTDGTMSGENVLTFTCNTGYNLVGSSTLTCQLDGTWDGSPPTCEAVQLQCPTLTPPLNGYLDLYGTSFRCHAGYNLVGPSTLTCLENGTWDGNPPTCEVVQCPVLTAPENGGKTGGNSYQDRVTFTCDPGYVLDGSSSLTCGADATWSGVVPDCIFYAGQCPLPTDPVNGAISGFYYGEMVTFTCNTGYSLVGPSTLTCQIDGTWDGSPPTCEAAQMHQCPILTAPTDGTMSGENVLTFTCNTGYNLVGPSTLTCQLDGTWDGSPPTCEAAQMHQCPILTAPTDGTMSGENVLTFTCNTGYNLVGSSTLTCQLDGTWDGSPPTCEVGQCPILTAPANGAVSGSNSYGDEITFTCNTGYNLVGSSTLTCQLDLTWSRSAPKCLIVQCPVLTAPENGGKTGGNSYQDRVTFTCDPGYVLDGSSSLTCGADATWTAQQCPILTAPTNGTMTGENVLTFTCNTGYNLVGPSTLTCQLDGTWDGSPPTCEVGQCPILTAPANGAVSGSNNYGDEITFTCYTGYNLVGSSTLTCQLDLTWSRSAPTCSIVQCPVLAAPENGGKTGGNSYQDRVTFTCDPGYVLDGSSSLTCGADATWIELDCPYPLSSPSNGSIMYVYTSLDYPAYFGLVAFYSCDPGYTLNGNFSRFSVQQCPILTAPTNGTMSGENVLTFTCNTGYNLVRYIFAFSCTAVPCPALTAPTNGDVSGDMVLTFTCNTGYNLVGSSTLTCQEDLTWDGSPPTCEVVQCPVLAAPENGGKTGDNSYQDVVTFTCDPGYVLDGSSSVTCGADTTWSGIVPTCTLGQCPTMTPPANGAVIGSNNYGDEITFTCNTGYNLVGSSTLTCQSDLTWSRNPPTCSIVQCPVLAAPENGGKTGGNSYQDVVTFTCDPGYVLDGSSSVTCGADATWSGIVPTCTRVQCPALQSPTNGDSSGDNYYQDVMSFTCESGYELEGSASITCQADGTWSGSAPSCTRAQCPPLTAPDNGRKTGDNFYQDVVTFLCDPGYELVGLSSLTCQADRTWSGNVPTCTRVQCPVSSSPINGISSGSNFYQDVVQFTCDQGYDLVGESISTCQADRTWSSNIPSCNDIDECSAVNGGCDHVCTNTIGSFQCSCVDGFELSVDSRTCNDVDECTSGNAGCHQNCNNIFGSYGCSCGAGYRLNDDGHTCSDVEECYIGNGGCEQTCTNFIGSFQCSCQNGYRLNNDGFTCDDIDECASGKGGCAQTCTNGIGSFQCSCGTGYGLNADSVTCDDLNECATANGGCDQNCINSIGSFECSCEMGYNLHGDGFSCDDIDECDTENGGCAQICNNTVGSFECFCRTGYILNVNGLVCDDVDECETANGGCGQFCNNTIGSFNCFCATGYNLSMDGIACDGLPPPTNVTISRITESSASVQWSKTAGALVVAYRVWVTDKETTLTVFKQYLTDSATSAAFMSLTPATEYVVTVACISLSIEGPQASLTIVTDTDLPRQLLLSDIRYSSLTLSWIPPVAELLEYELMYRSTERHRLRRSLSSIALPGDAGNYRIQGLVPATQYVISLTAVSRFGQSSTVNSTAVTATDPPSELEVKDVSSTWLNMAWTPPVAAVVSYALTVTDVTTQEKKHFSIPPAATDFNITGLFPSTEYILRIAAVSMYGRSVEAVSFGTTGHRPTTDATTVLTTLIGMRKEEGIYLLSKSSELIRSTQGVTVSAMETLTKVVTHTLSSLVRLLPARNSTVLDTTRPLFEMDFIDVNSVDVSPKQQLKNIKDKQRQSDHQLRNAGLSLLNNMERTADSLLSILPDTEDYVKAFENDDVDVNMTVARSTKNDTVALQCGQVFVSATITHCALDGVTDSKMIVMKSNLFSWNVSTFGQNVSTPLTMFSWGPRHFDNCSTKLNLSKPISFASIERPRRHKRDIQERGSVGTQSAMGDVAGGQNSSVTMALHAFDVPADSVVVVMQLSWWDHAAAFCVFFRYDTPPTEELYDDMVIVQEEDVFLAWHRGTNSLQTFTPNIQRRRGRLYVWIQKLESGILLQTTPSPEDYVLQATTVSLDLFDSTIRCTCSFPKPKPVVGGSLHVLPNSIDFDDIFKDPNILNNNDIVFCMVIGSWALYIVILVILHVDFQRLRVSIFTTPGNKKPLPLLSVLPPDRMPAPYLYQITVNTGSMFGAGTSARIGFRLFGSNSKTTVKVINPCGESMLRGGTHDLIMPQKTSLGHLELLHIWHDNTGVDETSWFLKEVIVKDLQTEEVFTKAERLSCCCAVFSSMMLSSAMWYKNDEGFQTKNTVYDLGFVQFTLQILVLAVLFALVCNHRLSDKQTTYNIKKEELHMHLYDQKAPKKVYPPGAASSKRMKVKNEQRRKSVLVVVEYVLLFLFVVILFYISHHDKDPFAFHASQTLSDKLLEQHDSITTADEFWTWSEEILLPVLYPSFWYNGWKMKYLDRQFPLYTEAFRIGPPLLNSSPATTLFSDLRDSEWIDKYTDYLVLDLSLYFPAQKLFSVLRLTVQQEDIGHLSTSATVETHRLFQYENGSDDVKLFSYIIFLSLFVIHLVKEMITMKKEGRMFFRSMWNFLTLASMIGSAAAICVFGIRYHLASAALSELANATGELGIDHLVDLSTTFWWDNVFKHVLAMVVFINTLTLLRVVRFSKTIARFIALPGAMKNELIGFSIIGTIALMAFSCSGTLLFGTHMKAYTNVLHTNFALFEMVLGRFIAQEILESNEYLGPVYFTVFMILIFILLIHFLVTIICDAIATGAYISDDFNEELADYIWKSFQGIFGVYVPPPKDVTTDEVKETELNRTLQMVEESLNETLDVTNCLWGHKTTDESSSTTHDHEIAQQQFSIEPFQRQSATEPSQGKCVLKDLPSTSSGVKEQVENLLKAHEKDTAKYEEAQNENKRRAEAMLRGKLSERRMKTQKKPDNERQAMAQCAQELMEQHAADEDRLEQQQRRNRRLSQSKLRKKMALRGMQKTDNLK